MNAPKPHRVKATFTGQLLSPELAQAVRRGGLYPLARTALYATECVRTYRENRAVQRHHPEVTFPPRKLLWATAPTTSYGVYLSGKSAAEAFYRLATEYLPEVRKVYEWGCGVASVIRHMPGLASNIEVFGSDYDPKVVEWCKANVRNVNFSLNTLEPPLPYADNSFDFVYSRSVDTHLSAGMQKKGLAEQLRVTKPGGLVLLTVHGDAFMHRLTGNERTDYDARGIVEHRTSKDGSPWYVTFNSPAYMERELLAGLEIVHRDILPEYPRGARQDLWIVRKPA